MWGSPLRKWLHTPHFFFCLDEIVVHCRITFQCCNSLVPIFIIWLVLWAGEMNQSYTVIGYLSGRDGVILPTGDYQLYCTRIISLKAIWWILYWPSLFGQDGWILTLFFFASLWTSTPSWSINIQKKNLAYIQPSWRYTWSISHNYIIYTPGWIARDCKTTMPCPGLQWRPLEGYCICYDI